MAFKFQNRTVPYLVKDGDKDVWARLDNINDRGFILCHDKDGNRKGFGLCDAQMNVAIDSGIFSINDDNYVSIVETEVYVSRLIESVTVRDEDGDLIQEEMYLNSVHL